MSNPSRTGLATAARIIGLATVLSAAAGPAVVLAGAAHAAGGGMHGDPVAAAPYWRHQQQDYDCAEMAVADVVGQITGHEPTEGEVTAAAGNIPSVSHPGPIYRPPAIPKTRTYRCYWRTTASRAPRSTPTPMRWRRILIRGAR
jgi:hypothetical protein